MTDSRILPDRYHLLEVLRDDDAEFLARAKDSTLHREVLLKAPGPGLLRHLGTVNEVESALREARALAKLDHENVIHLLDIVEGPGGPLLVLEPVAGQNLAERLANGESLPALDVLRIARGLSAALAAVHAVGAVHRGVAPENILIGANGEPVLVGFGFTKFVTPSGIASSIVYKGRDDEQTGAFPSLPLPRYPAPEQMLGQAADARSDLFALGATLYRTLTGVDAFDSHQGGGWKLPLPPSQRVKGVPEALNAAILRCLARSPMQRFQKAADLSLALESAVKPPAKPLPRLVILAIGSIGAGVLALAAFLVLRRESPASQEPSELRSHRLNGGDKDEESGPGGAHYTAGYNRSFALLIGIGNAYAEKKEFPALPNAERDVTAVAEQLRKMDWEKWEIQEVRGAEATKERLLLELAKLEETSVDNDRVLIYFAGHGERHPDVNSTGWIVPVDGHVRKTAKDAITLISYADLNDKIKVLKAKHVLLMLDCCFGGTIVNLRSRGSVANTRLFKEKAHVVITSGSRNERVPDGPEGSDQHSPFLNAFIKALKDDSPWLTASGGLYSRIQEAAIAGEGTGPMFAYLDEGGTGDFIFFLKPPSK